ncbi:MAG: PAS domain-containing protein [Gammaproteobacteria bacterium]|nr:PAS domain-containing protein [Gammaproteobacteria bacterium]MCP5298835.1 PAS domain-containing protein [Chromatiaceae bacterium]
MKPRITPTAHERTMRDQDFIVSKTDPRGRIVYANRIFMEFAGYSEKELLGTQHNIVRHPDMPRSVFKFMWETLESGREFFGYVKNMASDGSFYWVFANVTPTFDTQGRIKGYYSVRRRPNAEAVRQVGQLYADMLAAERAAGPKNAIDTARRMLDDSLRSRNVSYEEFVLAL